jgi:hypothetical protein
MWTDYGYAYEWFNDALTEARMGGDYNQRRREILFAVCFAENYLFEWVRDTVLKGDFDKLNKYFPPGSRRDVFTKWKDIPKQLASENLIDASPNLGEAYWEDFQVLIDYRNGLAHAQAARPENRTHKQPKNEKPMPSKETLDNLPAGWAVQVVVKLVQRFNDAAGTTLPSWLVYP